MRSGLSMMSRAEVTTRAAKAFKAADKRTKGRILDEVTSADRRRAAPARGRPAGRQRSRRFVVRRLRPASAVAAMPASTGDLMLVRVACSRRASDCCCAGGGFPAENQLGFLGAGE